MSRAANMPSESEAADALSDSASITDTRYPEIERAKGLAIILVVWGHLASATVLEFPTWFYISVSVVYSFHMPFFMYLSGFVFFLSSYQERFWEAPVVYVQRRIDRLIIPFVIVGSSIVIGKFALQNIGSIPDPVDSLYVGFWSVLSNGQNNPAASIWYLFVLFVYTILTPIIWRFIGGRLYILTFDGICFMDHSNTQLRFI